MQRISSFADRAGAAYLALVDGDARRDAGQVYTPQHLVGFILDRVGFDPSTLVSGGRLLDPACGAGAFLECAIERLASRLRADDHDLASPGGHTTFVAAVRASIFGVDIDPKACALAREAMRSAVRSLSPGMVPADAFDANVTAGDFLAEDVRAWLRPAVVDFTYIVGNPPYVPTTRLNDEHKDSLRRRFKSAHGRIDLYALFFEAAVGLLAPRGRVAFITPNKYLASQSAAPLRALLTREGAVLSLATFRSHKVFEDAATVPCVTVFERGRASGPVEVLECGERPDEAGLTRPARFRSSRAPPWQGCPPAPHGT